MNFPAKLVNKKLETRTREAIALRDFVISGQTARLRRFTRAKLPAPLFQLVLEAQVTGVVCLVPSDPLRPVEKSRRIRQVSATSWAIFRQYNDRLRELRD